MLDMGFLTFHLGVQRSSSFTEGMLRPSALSIALSRPTQDGYLWFCLQKDGQSSTFRSYSSVEISSVVYNFRVCSH